MVYKSGGEIFLVRVYRENGELQELLLNDVNLESALFNLSKTYEREFQVIENGDIKVLEEIRV